MSFVPSLVLSFVLSITLSIALSPALNLALSFSCRNAPAEEIYGVKFNDFKRKFYQRVH